MCVCALVCVIEIPLVKMFNGIFPVMIGILRYDFSFAIFLAMNSSYLIR